MTVNRRDILKGAAGAAAGLSLVACGSREDLAEAVPRKPKPLQYRANPDLPKPDITGSDDGFVPPAYFAYPQKLTRSVAKPPLNGGSVTAFGMNFLPPGPPLERNKAQQAVNQVLGGALNLNTASYTDYTAKFGTIMASGEMPDALFLHETKIFPRQAEMLSYLCADLGPILEGDGILEYPNLAAMPPFMWRNGLLNGIQYGVPNGQGGPWWVWMVADAKATGNGRGGTTPPVNADDFRNMLRENTGSGRWGLIADNAFPPAIPFAAMMWGAPRNWAENGGRLTKDIETEEFRAAVGYARDLFAKGYIYPEFPVQAQALDLFATGRAAFYHVTVGTTRSTFERLAREKPLFELAVIAPPAAEPGIRPVYHYTNGSYGKVVLRKADERRLREVLGVLNLLAAPFGSVENHLLEYGVEGHNFAWKKGLPQLLPDNKAELNTPYRYLMRCPDVTFSQVRSREFATRFHKWSSEHAAMAVFDPTIGLASRTYGARGSALEQMLRDELRNIVVGRSPLSAYADLVTDWRKAGGDRVRDELEKGLAASR